MSQLEQAIVDAAREAADLLRHMVQNDCMIDSRYTPTGASAMAIVGRIESALRDLDAPCETCGGTKLVPCGCFDKKNCQHIRGLRGCPTCGGSQ